MRAAVLTVLVATAASAGAINGSIGGSTPSSVNGSQISPTQTTTNTLLADAGFISSLKTGTDVAIGFSADAGYFDTLGVRQETAISVSADGGVFVSLNEQTDQAGLGQFDVLDAGTANIRNNFEVQGTTNLNGQTNLNSTTVLPSNVAFAPGATAAVWGSTPTISSGFGTGPNISSSAGTLSFTVNVGTGGSATNGAIGFPNACSHGYTCDCKDITQANNSPNITQQVTPFATNACTVANKVMSTGALVAWASADNLTCTATCH